MQFKHFNHVKEFIERGVVSYTDIVLHLPYFVEESNVEEAINVVPASWMDKFSSDVFGFDPKKEWHNTEYPFGLPPVKYVLGMALLRRQLERQSARGSNSNG